MEVPPLNLAALEASLRDDPTTWSFFQAVRMLERLRPDREPIGGYADPAQEVVAFSVNPMISFPPSELYSLEMNDEGRARMEINFMGLTGPQGVLPHAYSLLVSERRRAKDHAVGDFLDLFHHRALSLFYLAWEKHRFTVLNEKRGTDPLREHLLDLVGAGLAGWHELLPMPDDTLAFYAGLLVLPQRGAVALEQLLGDYFGVPVQVEQFVGGWYRLPVNDQCALGEDFPDASSQLGLGAVAGDEIWDQQARARVRMGPLSRAQFDRFLPTGDAFQELRSLTRFFGHEQYDFEVQLVLEQDAVPGCVLGDDAVAAQPLGWSTWIRSAAFDRNADETVLTL